MHKKIVLITGTSSGFGYELVSIFLNSGWTVIATLRNADQRIKIFQKELIAFPKQLFVANLDITSSTERNNLSKLIEENFNGKLDCLVNNAGFGIIGALEDLSENQIRQQMEVNFFGLVLLTKKLLPYIRNTKGRIINISSVLGYTGLPLSSMYCASKHCLEGLSESLHYELKPHGVQVTLVEPGGFKTKFKDNITWGENCFTTNSSYLKQSNKCKSLMDNPINGLSLESVTQAVLRLATKKKIPLRVRCGRDAKFIYFLRKLLPERIQHFLFTIVYKRIFEN